MSTAKAIAINFIAIVTPTAVGTDRKYLLPNLDGGKSEGLLRNAWGEMEEVLSKEENMAVFFADPFTLPEVGSDIENQLVSFTERVMDLAIDNGFEPTAIEGDPTTQWNVAVDELARFIGKDNTATVPIEQEIVPLTEEQSAAIVAEAETTPEGTAALEEAQEIVKEELGIEVSAEAALQILSGEKILKAQETSIKLSGAAKNKLTTVLADLQEVLEMVGASEHIQISLRDLTQAALPETVAVETAQ